MRRIVKAATAGIIVITTAVALYGLFLALVGMPATLVQEYNPLDATLKTFIRRTGFKRG